VSAPGFGEARASPDRAHERYRRHAARAILTAGAACLFAALALPRAAAQEGPLPLRTLIDPASAVPGAHFGAAVAPAGDFNGDGYDDIVVGAPEYDAWPLFDVGLASVFFGGPGANGRADLVLRGPNDVARLASTVACAGDINGDGYADIVIGVPGFSQSYFLRAGRAVVLFGGAQPDSIPDLIIDGTSARLGVGQSVAPAGDVNGDGYADFVVGGGTSNAPDRYVTVFFGGSQPDPIADWALRERDFTWEFGGVVAPAGDFDGDGYDDLLVGGTSPSQGEGVVAVYLGGKVRSSLPALVIQGVPGEQFGAAMAPAGDFNGDGYDDILIGAPLHARGGTILGGAFIFFGGAHPDALPDVELIGERPGDRFGCSVAGGRDLNGDGVDDVIVGAYRNGTWDAEAGRAYVYCGAPVADSLPDIVLTGAHAADHFGVAVAVAGDFDGDGMPDMLVGASGSSAVAQSGGRAYVYGVRRPVVLVPNGGETWMVGEADTIRWRGEGPVDVGLSTDGGLTWTTVASGVGGAGENFLRIVVPAEPTTAARVRVDPPGQTPTPATSDQSNADFRIVPPGPMARAVVIARAASAGTVAGQALGAPIAAAGDVDGDGTPDYVVGTRRGPASGGAPDSAFVVLGGSARGATVSLRVPGSPAGLAFAGAGDVNGDGFADIVVGAPYDPSRGGGTGRAFLYLGGPAMAGSPDLSLNGPRFGARFGAAVAGAGDVNGDGFDDLIVGAPLDGVNGAEAGSAALYLGGPVPGATPDLALMGAQPGDHFGSALAGVGRMDGDAFADYAVGSPDAEAGTPDAGRVYVFHGAAIPRAAPAFSLAGPDARAGFGSTIARAGDVNGDGFDDLLVGAPFDDGPGVDAGRAYLFLGGATRRPTPALTLAGRAPGEFFGLTLAGLGDLNRDGFGDFAIGAPFAAAPPGADAGRITVYLGGFRPDDRADFVWSGAAAGDRLGLGLAGPGDLNGDGFADALVGAPFADRSAPDGGLVSLFESHRYVLLEPGAGARWDVGGMRNVRWLGAEPADVWLSPDAGATWRLLAHAAGGADSNALAIRVPRPACDSARVRLSPAEPAVAGGVAGDFVFPIRGTISLLDFTATAGAEDVTLAWSTEPAAGAAGLAGYRIYRIGPGGWPVEGLGGDLLTGGALRFPETTRGATYVLVAVNGLGEETELARTSLGARRAGLTAWPVPLEERGSVTVSLALPERAAGRLPADLEVGVFDVMGRRVAELGRNAARTEVGSLTWRWDARDGRGDRLPSGVYVVRASSPSIGFRDERKIAVVR
jgi:hypothetical protein